MSLPGSPTSTRRRFPHGSHGGSLSPPSRQMLHLPFELSGSGSRRGARRCREVEIETEVWVRVRPHLRSKDHSNTPMSPTNSSHAVRMYSESHVGGVTIMNPLSKEISSTYHSFCFDRCMWSAGDGTSRTGAKQIDQDGFYSPIAQKYLPDLVNGFNTTFINYGQTSSGKSHTVFGRKGDEGYLPRCAQDVLRLVLQYNGSHKMRHIVVSIAALSIYRNEAYDLLTDDAPSAPPGRRPTNLTSVQVTSHISHMGVEEKEVHYPGLVWKNLYSIEDVDYYLTQVTSRRKTDSHTIVMIKLTKTHGSSPHGVVGLRNSAVGSFEQDPVRTSCSVLTVADLAGSEDLRRADQSERTSASSPKSQNSIANNKSLSVLRTVMERLSSKRNTSMELSPPVRDSLLTKILVNSLGGNCRSVLVANISPHASCYQETKNTLRFAETAKHVIGSLSFAQPDTGCDERIHVLRQALQDPWIDKLQRQSLIDLLNDELDEVAGYDQKLHNIVAHRHLLIANRETQQAVVDKYNVITSHCHQQAHQLDTKLESAQGAMKRIMDQLTLLESNKRSGEANDADVHILRSELEKATRNNQMLHNLRVKLLRRIDLLGFDQCSSFQFDGEEDDYTIDEDSFPDREDFSGRQYADPGPVQFSVRSNSPLRVPDSDTPLRSPPTDEESPAAVHENSSSGIEQALRLLSVKISAVSVGSAEANQLATCCKEFGYANANYSGILNAAAEYLSATPSQPIKQRPEAVTVYNSVADPLMLDVTETRPKSVENDASFMASHIQELVQKLHDSEVDNSSYVKKCHRLEREISLLNRNCQTLMEACQQARQHEMSKGASALLTEALAMVNYDVFSPQRDMTTVSFDDETAEDLPPVVENATRHAFIALKETTLSLLKYDDVLLLYPPMLRRKLDSVKTCLNRIDCSDPDYDVKPQLAVLRSELIAHRRDAASQTDKTKKSVALDLHESIPPEQSPLQVHQPFSQYDIKFERRSLPQIRTVDLAEATAKAAHLAIVVRRSDEASVIPDIKQLISMFTACEASESTELTEEALRRLTLNDAIGSAAALHAASAAASAMANMSSGQGRAVHNPSRLASLLSDLSELSQRLSRGEPVERPEIISLRDKACGLAGIGAGAAELAARTVSTKCLTSSTSDALKCAASTARRHNVLSPVMTEIVQLLSNEHFVNSELAAQLSTKSEQALSATRQSVVDVGEVLRLQSIHKNNLHSDITKHAINQAIHSVTVTLSMLPESSPGKSLLNSCIGSLQMSLSPDYLPSQTIDATQAAYTAVEKASCTGVLYATVTARRLAAACAELRGKAVGNPTREDIENIARQALVLAEDAENAESHPAAVVSSGLRGCSSQLRNAAQILMSEKKMTKSASENLGKAGADSWGAAEGHCCLRKAAVSLKQCIDDLLSNRFLSTTQKQLIDTQQNITAASRAVTCSQAAALINSLAEGVSQLRTSAGIVEQLDSRGRSDLCSKANSIYKEIAKAAGEPGPDEVAARFIAERLSELLREHTKPGEPLSGAAANTIQKALTDATTLSGAPTALEDALLLLKRKIESQDTSGIEDCLALLKTEFGIELSNDQNLLVNCTSTLQASETAKEVARRLEELGDDNVTAEDFILMSGDLSIVASNLPEGDQKNNILEMADKVLDLSRAQDEDAPQLSNITRTLERISGNLATTDDESKSMEEVAALIKNRTDKYALETRLSSLSAEHPKFIPIYSAIKEWMTVAELGDQILLDVNISEEYTSTEVITTGVKTVIQAACRPTSESVTAAQAGGSALPKSVVESMAASFSDGTLMRMVLLDSIGAPSEIVASNCSRAVIVGTEIGKLIDSLEPNQGKSSFSNAASGLFASSQNLPTESASKAVYDIAVATDAVSKKSIVTEEDLISLREMTSSLLGRPSVHGTPAQRLNTIITSLINSDNNTTIPLETTSELVALSQKDPNLVSTVDSLISPSTDLSVEVLFDAQRKLLAENKDALQSEKPAKDRLALVLQKLVAKKADGTLCKKDLQRAAQEAKTAAVKDARYKQIAEHLAQAAETGTISEQQLSILHQQVAPLPDDFRVVVDDIVTKYGTGGTISSEDLKTAADRARAAGFEQVAEKLENAANAGEVTEDLMQQLRDLRGSEERSELPIVSNERSTSLMEKLRGISLQLQQHIPGTRPSSELLSLIESTSSSYEDTCGGVLEAVTRSLTNTDRNATKKSTLQELTQSLLSGNHTEDVIAEAKNACARLRSNSVSLDGFASDAEKHLLDGDFNALARVLESAEKVMNGESNLNDCELVPSTSASMTTLLAALKDLHQRVQDKRAIPEEFYRSVRDAAANKAGFGMGISEGMLSYISSLQTVEESGFTAQALSFAVADAGKRYQVGALADVAKHLKTGSIDQVEPLIEPVKKYSSQNRTKRMLETTIEEIKKSDVIANSFIAKIEAGKERWATAADALKATLESSVGAQDDVGIDGVVELAGCLSSTLGSIAKAVDSGFADPDVISAQLDWIQREIQNSLQSLSATARRSIIAKALQSLHSELSNINKEPDITTQKNALLRQASKLRNGIDANSSVSKTYNLMQKVFQQFANGQVQPAQETLQAAVNTGGCIKSHSLDVFESLVELSEAEEIPPMMLAAATHDVLDHLREFCGKNSPEEVASLLISATLHSVDEADLSTQASKLDYSQLADQVSLLIGFPESSSESILLNIIDLSKQYFTSTDALSKSTVRNSITQQCESLLRCGGYLGDAAKIIFSEIDDLLEMEQGQGDTPPLLQVLDGVRKSQEKVRKIAGYLRSAEDSKNTSVNIETLTLCSGMALNAAAHSPGESGRTILELGELLCDAVGRLGRGMTVSTTSLLAAACTVAGINQTIENSSEFNSNTLQNLAKKAELHGLEAEAKVIADAALTMNFDGKTLAAVSKIASCTSNVTGDLEAVSDKIVGTGKNRTLEVAILSDKLSVLATENPRLRHILNTTKESLQRELVKGGKKESTVGVAMAVDTASQHPGLSEEIRQQLENGALELKQLVMSVSDYSMAALSTDIPQESASVLQYLVSAIDDAELDVGSNCKAPQIPVDFVITTAQQAVDFGCSTPLLISAIQSLKDKFDSVQTLCKDVCGSKSAPNDVRHLLYEAATEQIIKSSRNLFTMLDRIPFTGSDAIARIAPFRLQSDEALQAYERLDKLKLIDYSDAQLFEQQNASLANEIDNLKATIADHEGVMVSNQDGFVKLRGELDIARDELIQIDRKLSESDVQGKEKDSQIIKLEDACSMLESQLQGLESDQHSNSKEFSNLTQELEASNRLVLQKEKEMIELSDKISSIKQQHAIREEKDRSAIKAAIDNPALSPAIRQTLQSTMNESVVDSAKAVLAELYASQPDSLPQHLSQKIHSILTEDTENVSLSQVEEVLNLCKSEGIQLQSQTLAAVVSNSQDTDVQGSGMGKLASITQELSEKVRRGSCLAADTIRVCAEELRNSGAVGAATLAEEAARRFQVGDTVGAALVLEAAGLSAAEKSAHGVPIHPRLAGVIADLAELQRRILASEPVTTHEVSRLRGRALEASGLGASFIEASLHYLANLSTNPNVSQATLASLAQSAIQRHPSVSDTLLNYCKVIHESREAASDLLTERCDGFEECRLLAVQAGEVARRLRLGEVSADVTQSIGRAAGVARGIADRYSGLVSPHLEAAASGLRNCVDLLTASKPATDALWQATLQIEVAAGCGIEPTIQAARTLSSYLHDLTSSIYSGNRSEEEVNNMMLLLAAEATGAAYSGPSKSIVAITLADCGDWLTTRSNISSILERSSSALKHAADAQEAILRGSEFMSDSITLLSEGKDGSRTEVEFIKKSATMLKKASSGLASAATAAKAAGLEAISQQLNSAAAELEEVSTRCDESAKDGGHRVPPVSEILRIVSRISNVSGKAGGDEAAARLITERLNSIIESLRQGVSPIDAAGVALQSFPPIESVAAAAATSFVNDLGPSAGEATANVMAAQLQKAITRLEKEDSQIRDSPVAELIRIAVHDAGRAQIGNSIVANAMVSVEQLLHKALQNDQDNEVAASILSEAKDLCEGAGEASYCARSVARQLWGIESCAAYGIPPQQADLASLAEEAEIGRDKLQSSQQPLSEISKELVSLSEKGKLDDVPAHEYGRLCDAAAAAAGLPVRGAAGAAADLGDQIGAMASRIAAGGSVEKSELVRLSAEAKSAGDRHREGRTSFMLIAEELRDAATHTSKTNLRGTLARCKRLQSTLSGPEHTEMGTQWPDGEGLQAEGESVQKLRATLGKQMQEEMAKLNAKWKKKVQESEIVREQLAAEVATIAELMAETEFERDILAEKNAALETELQNLQEDALEGVDDIIADKDETIKLHIQALNSAAILKHYDDETMNRLEIELTEEGHISRLISTMDRRALENWQRVENGADEWLAEEAVLRAQLAEAGKACVDLEEAVSRREEEAKALRYEVEQVAVALTEEKILNEAEIASLKELVEMQVIEINALKGKGDTDKATAVEIDKLRDSNAILENKLAQADKKLSNLREQVDTLVAEKKSTESRIEILEEAEKEAQDEQEQALEMIASLEAQVATGASGGDSEHLKQDLARAISENAQLQKEHDALDEQAAEALIKSEVEIEKLETELIEARAEVAELTDLLEQVS